MRSTIKRLMVVVISMPVMALTSQPARALSCQDLRDAGDVLRYALPVWAYAMTAGYKDGRGAFQYTKTLVFTGMGTGILKTIGDKSRPRAQTSTESFVSGHVSSAMSGAAFIYTRYGKAFGIPAYLLAGLTAYSRQCSQAHFADDTLGGTMVALMSNWYATSPRKGNTELYPSFTSNGLGFSFKTFFDGNRKPAEPTTFNPRYRLLFELGPLSQDKNLVRAYNPGGDTLDFAQLETKFHFTARLTYERYLTEKHQWGIWYGPFGATNFDQPPNDFVPSR